MKFSAMTVDQLFTFGKYNLFTPTYPGDYMSPDDVDYLYYAKELAMRAPDKGKALMDMVLANAVPSDIPASKLDIFKLAGKFWIAARIAAFLAYTDGVVEQLPQRIAALEKAFSNIRTIALYYDQSQAARDRIADIKPEDVTSLCKTLSDFVCARYTWLGISQVDSAKELFKLWDIDTEKLFLMYIEQDCDWRSDQEHMDLDIFAQAVHSKPEEAIKLLERLKSSTEIMVGAHSSAKNYWIASWANFLYRYCNLGDEVLEAARKGDSKKGIVGKKTEALCQELKEAKARGLVLPSAADLADSKLAKKHLYALFSSNKELSAADVRNYATVGCVVWANFINDKLVGIFASDKGAFHSLYGDYSLEKGVYKMFNPADLAEMNDAGKILKQLAKSLKTASISTLINQLTTEYQDFSADEVWNNKVIRWCGNINSQQGMIVTAGKHFLMKGHESTGSYGCYHYVNPIDATGAVIRFDTIWSGPEYASELRTIYHAEFYKLPPNGFTYSDAVPESMKLAPNDVSPRLKYYIMTVFDSLAKDKASQDQPVVPY